MNGITDENMIYKAIKLNYPVSDIYCILDHYNIYTPEIFSDIIRDYGRIECHQDRFKQSNLYFLPTPIPNIIVSDEYYRYNEYYLEHVGLYSYKERFRFITDPLFFEQMGYDMKIYDSIIEFLHEVE